MASQSVCDGAASFAEVVIVRHGETTWNAAKIIQGHLNSELNDIGRQQAAAVANRISKEPKFSAIYSSDLKRAAETAQIIANSCGLPEDAFDFIEEYLLMLHLRQKAKFLRQLKTLTNPGYSYKRKSPGAALGRRIMCYISSSDTKIEALLVLLDPALRERHLGDLQGLALRDAAKLKSEAYRQFLSTSRNQEIPGGGESLNQVYNRCTSAVEKIARKHKGERVIIVTHGGVLRELFSRAAPNGKLPHGAILNTSVNVIQISDSRKWVIKTWGDISHLQGTEVIQSTIAEDKNFFAV